MQRLVTLCFLLASATAAAEGEWPQCAAEGQSCTGPFQSCCGGLRCENLLGSNGQKQCVRPQPQCAAEGQTCGGPGLQDTPCCGGMRCERHLMGTHNKQCVKPQPQCVKSGESCGCAGCQTLSCCGGLKCTESVGGGGHKFCLDSPWMATAAVAGQLRGSGRAEASNVTAEAAAETQVQAAETAETVEAAAVDIGDAMGSHAVMAGMAAANETEATLLGASGGCWADQGTLRTCGISCFSSHSRSSCISDCLRGKGVGSSCASCLGQKSDCSITSCLTPCAASATGAPCLQCVKDHCRSC